jgi:hypothetical protein
MVVMQPGTFYVFYTKYAGKCAVTGMQVMPNDEGKTYEEIEAHAKQSWPDGLVTSLIAANLTKEEAGQMIKEAQGCKAYYGGGVEQIDHPDMTMHILKGLERTGQQEKVQVNKTNITPMQTLHVPTRTEAKTVSSEEFGNTLLKGVGGLMLIGALPYLIIGGIVLYLVTR